MSNRNALVINNIIAYYKLQIIEIQRRIGDQGTHRKEIGMFQL